MATKNYLINDKWLDIDKQNIVELQSVDGVIDSLKVNGSEIETPSGKITITENGTDIDVAQYALADVAVEGGGSSDFSTAEVTFVDNSEYETFAYGTFVDTDYTNYGFAIDLGTSTAQVVLYKSKSKLFVDTEDTVTVSGNATIDDDVIYITGDCTITIS